MAAAIAVRWTVTVAIRSASADRPAAAHTGHMNQKLIGPGWLPGWSPVPNRPRRPTSGGWPAPTSRTRISVMARSSSGYQRGRARTTSATTSGTARTDDTPDHRGPQAAHPGDATGSERRPPAAAGAGAWPCRTRAGIAALCTAGPFALVPPRPGCGPRRGPARPAGTGRTVGTGYGTG